MSQAAAADHTTPRLRNSTLAASHAKPMPQADIEKHSQPLPALFGLVEELYGLEAAGGSYAKEAHRLA